MIQQAIAAAYQHKAESLARNDFLQPLDDLASRVLAFGFPHPQEEQSSIPVGGDELTGNLSVFRLVEDFDLLLRREEDREEGTFGFT